MRIQYGFWTVVLVFVALFALSAPREAHAASPTTTATMCDDGSYDQTVENNRNSVVQAQEKLVIDITNQFPIADASNACVQGIITVLQDLANPTYSDPFGFFGMLLTDLATSIINDACSAVMSTITQAQSLLQNTVSICYPMPNFSLNLGALNLSGSACSGGTQYNLINGYSDPPNALSSSNGYMSHP